MGNDRKIFGGFLGGLLLTVSNFFVSFIQLRVLLRHLPADRAGVWIIYLNIGAYILALDLGLSPTLGREVSFISGTPGLSDDERRGRVGGLIRTCTVVVSALAIGVFVFGSSGAWLYLRTIIPIPLAYEAKRAWTIFLAGAALNLVGEGWFAGIYGLGQVFTERLIRACGLVLGLIFLCIAIARGMGMSGLALAYVLQTVCTISAARYALARCNLRSSNQSGFDFAAVRRLTMPSIKYAATLLGAILILQTDNLVIASVLGARAVPDYQAAAKLVTALMSLSMMLVVTSQPFISKSFAEGNLSEVKRLLNRNLRYTLSIMVTLGAFLACFADRVIFLWLGGGHFIGFGIVSILLLVMLLESHHVSMATAAVASGKIPFFVPALLAGVLNLIFSVYLAKRFGLFGVALGTFLAQVTTNNWFAPWYTMRLFGISLREHVLQVVLPILGLIALLFSFELLTRYLTRTWSASAAVFAGACVVIIVGLCYILLFVLLRTERKQLSAIVRRYAKAQANIPPTVDHPLV